MVRWNLAICKRGVEYTKRVIGYYVYMILERGGVFSEKGLGLSQYGKGLIANA